MAKLDYKGFQTRAVAGLKSRAAMVVIGYDSFLLLTKPEGGPHLIGCMTRPEGESGNLRVMRCDQQEMKSSSRLLSASGAQVRPGDKSDDSGA